MKYYSIRKMYLFAHVSVYFIGCATLFKGVDEKIEITSYPEGAEVFLNDKYIGITPVSREINSNINYKIELKKNGYKTYTDSLSYSIGAGWIGADIIFPVVLLFVVPYSPISILGIPIDWYTQSWYELSRDKVYFSLHKQDISPNNNANQNVNNDYKSRNNINSVATDSRSNLDFQIVNLCLQISNEMIENNKTTVAVFDFPDLDGKTSKFGTFISEEVITKLFQTKKFKVIERQLLNKILIEQKLQASGIFDEKSVKILGKLLGVNTIVSGTIADLSNSIKINARLISSETGEIFATASCEIDKDQAVENMLNSHTK